MVDKLYVAYWCYGYQLSSQLMEIGEYWNILESIILFSMGNSYKCIYINNVSGIIHNSHTNKLAAVNCEQSTDYIFVSGECIYLPFCGDLRIFMKYE
jgi:hypothetical protein